MPAEAALGSHCSVSKMKDLPKSRKSFSAGAVPLRSSDELRELSGSSVNLPWELLRELPVAVCRALAEEAYAP